VCHWDGSGNNSQERQVAINTDHWMFDSGAYFSHLSLKTIQPHAVGYLPGALSIPQIAASLSTECLMRHIYKYCQQPQIH
jgi:hypothetical protein